MDLLLIVPIALFLAVSIPFSTIVEATGGLKQLKGKSGYERFMKLCCFASAVPVVMALFGVSYIYDFIKGYMFIYLFFLLIFGTEEFLFGKGVNKLPFFMVVVPCAIATVSRLFELMDIYAPIGRPFWCIMDISFLVGKALMMAGYGREEKET